MKNNLTKKDYSMAIAAGQKVSVPKGMPVTILEITPAMKKAVQEGSQSLFEILGFATGAGVGAKAVSENIQNNNISN